MMADDTLEVSQSAVEADGIEAEMAFLATLLAAAGQGGLATEGLESIEMLREEGAITSPRPRYERRGPTMSRVAAVGLASFPAVIAAVPAPAWAATELPPSLAIAMASRPPAPPANHVAISSQMFPFSHSMQNVRSQARTGLAASLPIHPQPIREAAGGSLITPPVDEMPEASTAIAASGLQLNPHLKQLFSQQRKVAVTTKRQFSSTFYQVSNGDSLYSIATDLLGSGSRWREIYGANQHKIGAGYTLRIGQKLVIPKTRNVLDVKLAHFKGEPANSPKYMVARGDSLYTIAARRLHDPKRWREIVAMNKAVLNGRTVIFPNQWLLLPSVT